MAKRLCRLVLAASFLAWVVSGANADAIYQYTANPFGFAVPPYTTRDFLTGTIQLSSALPPNLNLTQIDVTAFSFSDGVQTLTSTNASLPSPGDPFGGPVVSTDGSGAVTAWDFFILGSGGYMDTFNRLQPQPGVPFAEDRGQVNDSPLQQPSALISNDPGVWTLLPEPSTALLVTSGVVALAATRRK